MRKIKLNNLFGLFRKKEITLTRKLIKQELDRQQVKKFYTPHQQGVLRL